MTQFGKNSYSFLVASDVVRDGLGLEAWKRLQNNERELVAEVFWSDKLGTLTMSTYQPDLPIELVEHLLTMARLRLTPAVSTKEAAE